MAMPLRVVVQLYNFRSALQALEGYILYLSTLASSMQCSASVSILVYVQYVILCICLAVSTHSHHTLMQFNWVQVVPPPPPKFFLKRGYTYIPCLCAHAPCKENSAQTQDGYCMVFPGSPKQVDSRPRPSTNKDNARPNSIHLALVPV